MLDGRRRPHQYNHIEEYWKSKDDIDKFWLRENIPILVYVDDYELYGSQVGIVTTEVTWAEVRARLQRRLEANST